MDWKQQIKQPKTASVVYTAEELLQRRTGNRSSNSYGGGRLMQYTHWHYFIGIVELLAKTCRSISIPEST